MISSDPTSPDYVEDYDFFEVKRQERLRDIGQQKKLVDEKQRAELKKKSLNWRVNGTKALDGLKSGVTGLRFLLEPHHNTKRTVAYFEQCVENMQFETAPLACTRHSFPLACRVLYCCTALEVRQRWFRSKANLIVWKFAVMQELKYVFALTHPFEDERYERPTEVRVLRHLFREYMREVPIEHSISEELKKKRANFKVVTAKLKLIHDTQRACDLINVCKSRQHTNPNGCSNCGVQYIGGMLNGGTPYVQSCSRDTGLKTLVTLEFEVETLRREEEVQLEIVDQVEVDLRAYEEVVCGIVRVKIQAWWSIVLVWKRYKRKQVRMKKSVALYQRRRLVTLKRDVDRMIKEPAPLDMERYADAYCDVLPAMYEYTALQTRLKHERLQKWAKNFRRKLVVLVEEARERQYQEYLRLLALPKPPRPIVFKTIEPCDNTNLVCYRLECKMRKFLTRERYDIHMNVHYKQDNVRYERYDQQKAAKKVRDAREGVVLHRIMDSKLRITHSDPEFGSTATGGSSTGGASDDEVSLGSQEGSAQPSMSQLTLSAALGGSQLDSLSGSQAAHPGASTDGSAGTQVQPVVRGTGYARRKELHSDYSPRTTTSSEEGGALQLSPVSASASGLKHITTRDRFDITNALRASSLTAADRSLRGAATGATKEALMDSEHSLRDSQDAEMNFETAQSVQDWAAMTHIYALHSMHNDCLYSLELVSKQGEVEVAQRIPLDRPVIRIGSHSTCECVVTTTGAARRESKVAKVHCLLYCPTHRGSTARGDSNSHDKLTLVDNSSVWGTYVVSAQGTRKAPVKVTAGMVLTSGLLLCIGVCKDGPAEISATQANQACVVYRVRCLEQEEHS